MITRIGCDTAGADDPAIEISQKQSHVVHYSLLKNHN
jgi:hypothetical protein